MSGWMPMVGDLFGGVLEASLHASLLALAAGLLLWVLRERVSPRVKHAAWMLVAARLCVPAELTVPVGPALPRLQGEPAPADAAVFLATQGEGPAPSGSTSAPRVSPAPPAPPVSSSLAS